MDVLRRVFTDPESLRPGLTSEGITKQAAELFGQLADGLRVRGIPAPEAAHFLMKLMFCMFAEDIGLLPERVFSRLLTGARKDPVRLSKLLGNLFEAMCQGGNFGADEILYFNGGLFDDAEVIELRVPEVETLATLATFDWSAVEPSIFGTLFERTLDPAKRSQIGAHYTSREDIETLLQPVVMAPLRTEWAEVRARCDKLREESKSRKAKASDRPALGPRATKHAPMPARMKGYVGKISAELRGFVERLAHVQVLDPACGSGNFLYVAIRLLLDLEKEVITFGADYGVSLLPQVRATQLHGIEINPYAQQLAQVVIWIGFLQWMRDNGFTPPRNPVLEPIESIHCKDAIVDLSDPENPKEPDWPAADFIVGNPPFLGNKLMRSALGEEYVAPLWKVYRNRLPPMSDLCCYWLEKARSMVEAGHAKRVGLLATTGIKQVGGRQTLDRINATGRIFFAESDREWTLDGASVRIVMVGFEATGGSDPPVLDGKRVPQINADLTAGANVSAAKQLGVNANRCFMGTTKVGAFDMRRDKAVPMLLDPNPHGKPNSDVLRPCANGSDIVRNPSNRWIVDYGVDMAEDQAALYCQPFAHVAANVKAERSRSGQKDNQRYWWIHARPRPAMRNAMNGLSRYIGTARVAKHRLFVWLDTVVLPDSKVIAFAFDDALHFGVLHSRLHEVWTLALCGWHGKGNDATYNPTTCFETFPFPSPTD